MQRFFTILEEDGKGETKRFESGADRMLVGRSRDAGIWLDDSKASRRHLEVRIFDGVVYVKNLSPIGFKLNDRPHAGEDNVRMNAGDVLTVGGTRLRYDEIEQSSSVIKRSEPIGIRAPEEGETRAASEDLINSFANAKSARLGSRGHDQPNQEETRAVSSDETPLLRPDDLPDWRPPQIQKNRPAHAGLVWALLALMLGLIVAGAWLRRKPALAQGGTIEFRNALNGGYGISFPSDWTKMVSSSETNVFGFGRHGSTDGQDWGRVRICSDKQPVHADAGLTLGFQLYKDIWKERFPEFQLTGAELFQIVDVSVMRFGFVAGEMEGEGIFLLDGDSRIVVECYSPSISFPRHKQAFRSILMSLRLLSGEPQHFIDFPLPDQEVKTIAMVDPHQASLQVEEFTKRGDDLLSNWTVRDENLYLSLQAYRRAIQLQLAMAGTSNSASFLSLAQKLRTATGQYQKVILNQQFEITRAERQGRKHLAAVAAYKVMQTVVEKSDPVYQKALKSALAATTKRGNQ